MDCSCAPMLQFFSAASDGTTTEHQIQNHVFWSFFPNLKKDSVANYVLIWTLYLLTVRGSDVLCKTQNVSQLHRQLAPQDSQFCGKNFPKRKKKSAAVLCQILCIVTIQIVINTAHLQQHMHVTMSCRYCIAMLFFLVYTVMIRNDKQSSTRIPSILHCNVPKDDGSSWLVFNATFSRNRPYHVMSRKLILYLLQTDRYGMVYQSLTSHSTQYRSFRRQQLSAVMYISHSVMEGQRHNNPLNPRCFCSQRPKRDEASS